MIYFPFNKIDSFSAVIIPIILKLEEDIRERVLYLAHLFLDSTIHDYIPNNDDVNYPQKLYGRNVSRSWKSYGCRLLYNEAE